MNSRPFTENLVKVGHVWRTGLRGQCLSLEGGLGSCPALLASLAVCASGTPSKQPNTMLRNAAGAVWREPAPAH